MMRVSYFFHPFIMFRSIFITILRSAKDVHRSSDFVKTLFPFVRSYGWQAGITFFLLLGVSAGTAHASHNYKPFVGSSLQGTVRTFVGPRPSPGSFEAERYAREQREDLIRRSQQAVLGVHDRQPNRPDF